MAATATQPIDVRDMAIVHQAFRRAYDECVRLVRANPTPSAARVAFLADHIDFGIAMLHVHHAGEDALLYPKLIERVPEQDPMLEQVDAEHKLIDAALDAASAANSAWRAAPSAASVETLAAKLEELNAVTRKHLDDEEGKVVPLAAVTLTQDEWEAIGKHGLGEIPKNKRPLAFGLLMEPLNDEDRAYMKKNLPAPVRILYPLLIDRPWKKYAATLRNAT